MPGRRILAFAAVLGATVCAAFPLATKPPGFGGAQSFATRAWHPISQRRVSPAFHVPRRQAGLQCAIASTGQAVADGGVGSRAKLSPAQARAELQRLASSDQWEKDAVVSVLNNIEGKGGAQALFNSSAILFRKTSKGEVQMLTRGVIKPGTIDLNGDDDMEVLNQAFYATLFSSMALSTVAAVVIPDVPDMPFLRDSVLRFMVTFGVGALPFAFLGAGLSVPGLLQAALIQVRRLSSEEFRLRLVVHEAGHLLVGYCMGLPVADYKANDPILNACQFFEVEDDIAGRISHEQVDVMCSISLAGVVAESMKLGDGIGGFADLTQLQGFISRATPRLDDKQQMERVRWGCISAFTTLKQNEEAFDKLVEAMTAGATIPECVEILEEVGRPTAQ